MNNFNLGKFLYHALGFESVANWINPNHRAQKQRKGYLEHKGYHLGIYQYHRFKTLNFFTHLPYISIYAILYVLSHHGLIHGGFDRALNYIWDYNGTYGPHSVSGGIGTVGTYGAFHITIFGLGRLRNRNNVFLKYFGKGGYHFGRSPAYLIAILSFYGVFRYLINHHPRNCAMCKSYGIHCNLACKPFKCDQIINKNTNEEELLKELLTKGAH